MTKINITICGNLRIDNPVRLQHLKDSFWSFHKISDDWLINIRGEYRREAMSFLKKHVGRKGTYFSLLADKKGWINNTIKMLKNAKNDYILLWNEDHLNIAPIAEFPIILNELSTYNVDFMSYSWWPHYKIFIDELKKRRYIKGKVLGVFNMTKHGLDKISSKNRNTYIISHAGIFKKEFLLKILLMDRDKLDPKVGYYIFVLINLIQRLGFKVNSRELFNYVNILLRYRLSKYPKETPFEMEKDITRKDILPFIFAFPKNELFVCIDDDNEIDNYQLIKRGLYPVRKSAKLFKEQSNLILEEIRQVLGKVDQSDVNNFVVEITAAKTIVCCGAGRAGLSNQAFAMRLSHLGFKAFNLGDSNVPSIGKGDLLIVGSGSGETRTIFDLVRIAKRNGARVALITANPDSRMGRLADIVAIVKAPSKLDETKNFQSVQPMTTLNEQCLWIFYDSVVLILMEKMKIREEFMKNRHSILE